jgi:CheY-like chemotaxis protein
MSDYPVLVVEDNPLNMKLVRSLLQLDGFRVLEAVDAEAGIRLARSENPVLILMDIQLPGIDGLEATKLLKADRGLRNIPVVALTSYAMEGDRRRAFAAGCVDFIAKPIDVKNFASTLYKYIREENTEE